MEGIKPSGAMTKRVAQLDRDGLSVAERRREIIKAHEQSSPLQCTTPLKCRTGHDGLLKNKLNLRKQTELDAFEAEITAQRAKEPLPSGRLVATRTARPSTSTSSKMSVSERE
ncbi:hypothetical protein ACNJX9_35900 [Bradyrhizobium sp. DASA03076]|uniref:hypothetical protein n=1 Tax=Bradyrhizobium sp. BLXBL-03 TaxID=3395916 RepID=UPI003F72EABB